MTMNWAANAMRDALERLNVPISRRRQAGIAAPRTWPPKPGWTESGPYPGVPRVWADFSLREWAATAPGVLYRTTPQEAAAMDAIAARLRRSGEGAQVLWGLDLWGRPHCFPLTWSA